MNKYSSLLFAMTIASGILAVDTSKNVSSKSKLKKTSLKLGNVHHEPIVLKKPVALAEKEVAPKISSPVQRKCLADFNNPAQDTFILKTGDKHNGWHDARKGSCSASCECIEPKRRTLFSKKWELGF